MKLLLSITILFQLLSFISCSCMCRKPKVLTTYHRVKIFNFCKYCRLRLAQSSLMVVCKGLVRKEGGELNGEQHLLGEYPSSFCLRNLYQVSFVIVRDHCCSLNGTLYPPNGTVMSVIKDSNGCDQVTVELLYFKFYS